MEGIDVEEFARLVGGTPVGPPPAGATVEHVSVHSERIPANAAFFALPGRRADGHEFVGDALGNGAVVAVVAAGRAGPAAHGPQVEVDDPLLALHRLARWWRSQLPARVVAVVGSNGKTITKDALAHFAGFGAPAIASPGSYNSQLGVPLALLGFPRSASVAVVEAAVSGPGEMAVLEDVVRPDHVVLTNMGLRWQSQFPDRRARAAELVSMARRVGPGGWLLVGEDDSDLRAVAGELAARVHWYNSGPDVPGFTLESRRRALTVLKVSFPGGESGHVNVLAPSDEISADVGLAMTAAWLLGTPADELLVAAEQYRPTSTRLETWRAPANYTVVRDVATPDPLAVSSGIRAARRHLVNGGRLIVVLSEPPPGVSPGLLAGLAQSLVSEGAGAVFGLAGPNLRRVASILESSAAAMEVSLFDDVAGLRARLLGGLSPGDVVLIQSVPSAGIGDEAATLIESVASPRVYFDVAAVEHNVRTFRRIVGSSVRIMAMVKALAYGTDPVPLSLALQEAGVDELGVAKADEGIDLRRAGLALPIVVFDPSDELDKVVRHGLTPLLHSPELVRAACERKAEGDARLPVYLEVDTGMHRTGLAPDAALEALGELRAAEQVRIVGVMTHFAASEDPASDGETRRQLQRFQPVIDAVRSFGWSGVTFSAANTAATIRHPDAHLDMVRLGLGLHGLYPSDACRPGADLVPALGLVSRLVDVRRLEPGERIGYGWTYEVPAGGGLYGTVNCGYEDGVPRSASNRAYVMVAGCRCPIVGTVSMDSMTIDLSECPYPSVGDEVLVYGRHGDACVPLEEFSALAGTIPYEPLTRIGSRVQRIFTGH